MKNSFIVGLAYLLALTFLAILINNWTNNFIGQIVIALLLGMAASNLFKIPESWNSSVNFGEKKVLGWAIGLMGLQLSFMKLQTFFSAFS